MQLQSAAQAAGRQRRSAAAGAAGMDLQSKNNAREALNNLKMEISSELGYYYNMRTDKIEGLAPQGTLDGMAENIKSGVEVGGMTSRKLVEMG